MGLLNGLAKLAGESIRIKKGEAQTANMSDETRALVDQTIAAAQKGDLQSMFLLATWYYRGEYVGYDPDKACEWWNAAAERGDIASQYNLGLLYLGDVSSYYFDPNLAGYWLNCAANNGDQEALQVLNSKLKYSYISKKWRLR